MKQVSIYEPIFGFPLDLSLFDDGTFSFIQPVTHKVITGHYTDYALTIPIDLFNSDTQPRSILSTDAAKILGVSRTRITQLCNEGKLKSAIIGNSLFVNYDDVMEYKNSDRTPGRKGMTC